jgi:hypothetical protein
VNILIIIAINKASPIDAKYAERGSYSCKAQIARERTDSVSLFEMGKVFHYVAVCGMKLA